MELDATQSALLDEVKPQLLRHFNTLRNAVGHEDLAFFVRNDEGTTNRLVIPYVRTRCLEAMTQSGAPEEIRKSLANPPPAGFMVVVATPELTGVVVFSPGELQPATPADLVDQPGAAAAPA